MFINFLAELDNLKKRIFLSSNFFSTAPPRPIFRKSYPDPKLKNNWGLLSSTFHVEQPATLIEIQKYHLVFWVKKVFWSTKFLGQKHPDPKVKNNWGHLSLTFHVEQPGTLIEWKFKSITYGRTDLLG